MIYFANKNTLIISRLWCYLICFANKNLNIIWNICGIFLEVILSSDTFIKCASNVSDMIRDATADLFLSNPNLSLTDKLLIGLFDSYERQAC